MICVGLRCIKNNVWCALLFFLLLFLSWFLYLQEYGRLKSVRNILIFLLLQAPFAICLLFCSIFLFVWNWINFLNGNGLLCYGTCFWLVFHCLFRVYWIMLSFFILISLGIMLIGWGTGFSFIFWEVESLIVKMIIFNSYF